MNLCLFWFVRTDGRDNLFDGSGKSHRRLVGAVVVLLISFVAHPEWSPFTLDLPKLVLRGFIGKGQIYQRRLIECCGEPFTKSPPKSPLQVIDSSRPQLRSHGFQESPV